jgi:hypothetical protein
VRLGASADGAYFADAAQLFKGTAFQRHSFSKAQLFKGTAFQRHSFSKAQLFKGLA